jgi:hypothetical protein
MDGLHRESSGKKAASHKLQGAGEASADWLTARDFLPGDSSPGVCARAKMLQFYDVLTRVVA